MTTTRPEPDLAEAAAEAAAQDSLYERLGGTYGIAGAVDIYGRGSPVRACCAPR